MRQGNGAFWQLGVVMRIVLLCVLTVSSAARPGIAAADPITFRDADFVGAYAVFQDNGGHRVDDGEQVESSTSAAASASVMSSDGYVASADSAFSILTSDPRHLSAIGTGKVSATTPSTNKTGGSGGSSFVSIARDFVLDAPHTFDFDAVFAGSDGFSDSNGRGFRAILAQTFTGDDRFGFNLGCFEECFIVGTITLNQSGMLPPSSYFLQVLQTVNDGVDQAGSARDMHGEFSFDLDLAPVVPEPASLVLLSSGVLGLLAFRQRRA